MLKIILMGFCLQNSWAQDIQVMRMADEGEPKNIIVLDSMTLTPLDVDQLLLEEVTQNLYFIEKDLSDLFDIQDMLIEMLGEQAVKLDQAEAHVENSEQYVEDGVENLQDVRQLKQTNFLQLLILQDGLPLGAGALLGTTGFLASKAAILSIPPLAMTAAPVAIPAALAAVTGGAAWFGSKFIMHKLTQ